MFDVSYAHGRVTSDDGENWYVERDDEDYGPFDNQAAAIRFASAAAGTEKYHDALATLAPYEAAIEEDEDE